MVYIILYYYASDKNRFYVRTSKSNHYASDKIILFRAFKLY